MYLAIVTYLVLGYEGFVFLDSGVVEWLGRVVGVPGPYDDTGEMSTP